MLRVKGTFAAFVDYISSGKSKKVKDAVLFVEFQQIVRPPTVVMAVIDENLIWVFNEDVSKEQFLTAVPKGVQVERISEVPNPVR